MIDRKILYKLYKEYLSNLKSLREKKENDIIVDLIDDDIYYVSTFYHWIVKRLSEEDL